MSWSYFKIKKNKEAYKGFEYLFKKGYKREFVSEALFFLNIKRHQYKRARLYLSLLPSHKKEKYKRLLFKTKRKKKIKNKKEIEQARLNKKLKKIFFLAKKKRWAEVQKLISHLPAHIKKRKDIMVINAWALFNLKKFNEALPIFLSLNKLSPKDESIAYGLVVTSQKLNKKELALKISKKWVKKKKFKDIWCNLTKEQIVSSYNDRHLDNISHYYKAFKAENCNDIDGSVRQIVGWSYLLQKKYSKACPIFYSLYERDKKTTGIVNGYIECLRHTKDKNKLWNFMDNLATSDEDSDKRIAQKFYLDKGLVKLSSFILNDPKAPNFNSHTSFSELGYSYNYLDGDSGISKLHMQVLPFGIFYTHPMKNLGIKFGISHLLLQTGTIPDKPWFGTPTLKDTRFSSHSSVNTIVPRLEVEYETKWYTNLALSSTPINGPVGALPTFDLSLKNLENGLSFSVYQRETVRSLLSLTGQKDPYTGKNWGRVLDTGLSLGLNRGLFKDYWFSLKMGYSHLWGKDTWNNDKVYGNFSFGKSISNSLFSDLSIGIYSTVIHHKHNTNFYTFGHGGYFSPQFFLATGPFIHMVTKDGKNWLLEFEGAVSWLNYYEESSPLYPLEDEKREFYLSNQTNKLGYSSSFSFSWLFTPHFIAKLHGNINKSADYTQWGCGISFVYLFDSRNGLFAFDLPPSWKFIRF